MVDTLTSKRLLVLGGSRQAKAGLQHLQECGLELVVCDMDPEAPGFEYAAHKILASVYHTNECLPAVEAFHKETPIDGVMCLACDVPHIVARIAEKLELPGIPVRSADLAVDKLAMKEKFASDGVSIPEFWQVENTATIQKFMQTYGDLVVKPVDSRGSKGVSLLDAKGNAEWAFSYAKENSPSGRVMVEKYLSGPQVSTESVVIAGEAVTEALSDRSYEYLDTYRPFIVEDGGDMPSSLPHATQEAIKALVSAASKSLGITNGIVKGDIVVHEGKPYVIELAARLSGGYFCTHQIPFSTGLSLVEANARIALGELLNPADWLARKNTYVSTRWKLVEAGLVEEVADGQGVLVQPGVLAFEHWISAGDRIQPAQNAAASVAMVQAQGTTQVEARERAIKALEIFHVKISP